MLCCPDESPASSTFTVSLWVSEVLPGRSSLTRVQEIRQVAYALLQQAEQGSPVSSAEISRALANVQAAAGNSDEQMAARMLGSYRSDIDYTRMKITSEQLASTMASMKQTRCEIGKMFNEGFRGTEAMNACGEKLG
jgi:hypothetical protein